MLPDIKNSPKPTEIISASEILADMTRKWGKIVYNDRDKLIFSPSFVGVKGDWTILVSNNLSNQTVVISKGWGEMKQMNIDGNSFNSLPLARRNAIANSPSGLLIPTEMEEGGIIVDKEIDIDVFNQQLMEVDMAGMKTGLIVGGQRKNISNKEYYIPQKRKIEDVFTQKGMLVAIPNGKFEAELATFEHPEELAIWVDPLTNIPMGIIRKVEAGHHQKRFEVTSLVLAKYNLTPEMIISGMNDTPEMFASIVKVIKSEVDSQLDEKTI